LPSKRFSIFLFFLLISFSIFAFFKSIPQTQAESWSWQDEFTDTNSRWIWSYHTGTGYHKLSTIDGYSVVECGITSATSAVVYSDCALRYFFSISTSYVTIEFRMKFSHNLVDGVSKGSEGCIIWGGSISNALGFFTCSPESAGGLSGWRAVFTKGGSWLANEYIGDVYDPTDWHIYKMEITPSGSKLYVDDNMVMQSSQRPSVSEMNFWVDNGAYQASGARYNLDVTVDQMLYMDYVYFYQGSIAPSPSPSPTPTSVSTPSPSPSLSPTATPNPTSVTTPPPTTTPGIIETPLSPKPTMISFLSSPPEEFYAVTAVGLAIIIAAAIIAFRKRQNNHKYP
jgi:hypothetical protein